MTKPVSWSSSRNVTPREDDEASASVAPPKEKPAPTCRDRLVSEPTIDWDRMPTMCDANSIEAVKNASAGGMCGGTQPGVPMTSTGKAPEENASAGPPQPRALKPPVKTAGASTNAARTAERDFLQGGYAAAGTTHDRGSVFVGAAALKGRTTEGVEGEALGVSAQVGEQNEAQGTFARLGYSGKNMSGSLEAFTANAHLGVDNSDGSKGVNAGALATLASGEVTIKHSGGSVTGGLSLGAGAEAHVGVRDDDNDGKPELCMRVAWGFGIGGLCIESPLVIKP